jgi:hypothetical protein
MNGKSKTEIIKRAIPRNPRKGLFMNDFSRKTVSALARKGITIIGTCAIPAIKADGSPDWCNADRGYKLNDNGCQRIRSFSEVLETANA